MKEEQFRGLLGGCGNWYNAAQKQNEQHEGARVASAG